MNACTRRGRAKQLAVVAGAILTISSLVEPTLVLGVGVEQILRPPAGWTVDLTGRVSPDTLKAINHLGDEVRQQTGAELAVVVVESTDGADPHQFATDLFNRWRLGQAGRNNGVLVFAALGDRKAEIILGDGVDDEAQVLASRRIMQEVVLPRFKQGDPGGAVFRGARACAEEILGARLEPLQAEVPDPVDGRPEATPAAQPPPAVQPPQRPAPIIGRLAFAAPRRDPAWTVLGWLAGGTGGLGALVFGVRKYLRYHGRFCPACGGNMTRLSETADDEYLSQGERTEERLGSIDYDVWACGTCGKTNKLRYGAFFTRYSRCPKCRAKTKSTVKRTIHAATYSQGGLVEIEDLCHNCSYRSSRTHSTPMLTDNTAASTTVWSSMGASPTSTSPSTSFGGGATGGHSSGAGASGGW